MKKRRIFLMLAMVMCMVSMVFLTTAFAAGVACEGGDACQHEAAIGDKHYSTLKEAITESKGKTVTLLKNITDVSTIKITKNAVVKIDLNNHEIGFASNKFFSVQNTGTLSLTGSGRVYEQFPSFGPVRVTGAIRGKTGLNVGKDVTLEGFYGVFIDNGYKYGIEVTVDGTLKSVRDTNGAVGAGVYINGKMQNTTGAVPKVTLSETSIIESEGAGIYAAGYGEWQLAGQITAGTEALSIKCGTFNINGGSYTANGQFRDPADTNNNGSEATGAALSITSNDGYAKKTVVNVSGGTFKSQNGYAVYEGIAKNENGTPAATSSVAVLTISDGTFVGNTEKGAVEISTAAEKKIVTGGNYSNSVIAYVSDDLLAELHESKGTAAPYSYGTLQETLERAEPGDKITLFRNVTIADGETVTIPEGVTVIVAENTSVTNHGSLIVNGDLVAEPNAGENPEEDNKRLNIQGTGTITPGQNGFVDVDTKTNTSTMHKITFDANGGTCDIDTLIVSKGIQISLPMPTRSGYVFQGWFDGEKVYQDSYTVGNTDVKLTAQWTYIPPTYAVSVPTADNGKLSVSPKYAVGGQTVTITATPNEGYKLDTLTVTDAKGNELELKDLGDGKYSFKMPYGKVNVSATFVETEPEPVIDPVKDCSKDGTCPAAKFTDVDRTAWYHDGVHYCIAEGLMNGTGATTFEPLETTNRAMLVTILYRLEGEPAVGENQFADVAADEWYTKAVSWAAANGIVKGYGDGTFGPMDTITREQMATILHRYAAYKGYDVTAKGDLTFTDANEVSDWAEDAMTWTVGAELINGVGNNRLEPEGNAQRAQIATILYRFCENIVK